MVCKNENNFSNLIMKKCSFFSNKSAKNSINRFFPIHHISLYFIMHIVMQLHSYLEHTIKPGNSHPLYHSILLSAGPQRQMFL